MNGILGFPLNYLVDKNQISQPYPRRVQNYPSSDSIRITRGFGGYTRQVRSRAPSGESKYPPGRFCPNHPRARRLHPTGALARTLWQIEIPPGRFYPNHSGATPVGCARAHPLASQITLGRFHPNHPGAQGLLSGTDYWGTQRGGTNNHQTLMLPNRQKHSYASCPNA